MSWSSLSINEIWSKKKKKKIQISCLEFFFWRYFFGHTTFLFLSSLSSGNHQSFFYFKLFRESQSQQELTKNITHFTIQCHSKKLTHFTHLNSLRNTAKNLSDFTNFWSSLFPFFVRKNIFTSQELHSWSTLKANIYIFLYIFVRTFLFQRRSKILSGGGKGLVDWIIFLRQLAAEAS